MCTIHLLDFYWQDSEELTGGEWERVWVRHGNGLQPRSHPKPGPPGQFSQSWYCAVHKRMAPPDVCTSLWSRLHVGHVHCPLVSQSVCLLETQEVDNKQYEPFNQNIYQRKPLAAVASASVLKNLCHTLSTEYFALFQVPILLSHHQTAPWVVCALDLASLQQTSEMFTVSPRPTPPELALVLSQQSSSM